MYDSIYAAKLPSGGDLYAGYVGGGWPTFADGELAARFPGVPLVSIAVASYFDAMVLDVERGDATPDLAPSWAQRQRARGQTPTVYCTTSVLPTVRAAFAHAGVAEPFYFLANYTMPAGSVFDLAPGVVAHQYGGDRTAGWDVSLVADHWPGVDEEDDMTPAQAQQLQEVHDMLVLVTQGAKGFGILPTPVAVSDMARKLGVDMPPPPGS